jgi:hypothetical protein
VGVDCAIDTDCSSNVCWNFHDYDPWCGGAVCSELCTTDQQCVNVFIAAGAPNPSGAFCGFDGRCDPMGTGMGAFFCA